MDGFEEGNEETGRTVRSTAEGFNKEAPSGLRTTCGGNMEVGGLPFGGDEGNAPERAASATSADISIVRLTVTM